MHDDGGVPLDARELVPVFTRLDEEAVPHGERESREHAVDARALVREHVVADEDDLSAAHDLEKGADREHRGREEGVPPLDENEIGTRSRRAKARPDPREGIDRIDEALRIRFERRRALVELRFSGEEKPGIEAREIDRAHFPASRELPDEAGIVVRYSAPVGVRRPYEAEPSLLVFPSHRSGTRDTRTSFRPST